MPLTILRDISISIKNNIHDYGHNAVYLGPPEADMDLMFHLSTREKPLILIMSDLESKLKSFCYEASASFIERRATKVRYDGEWHYEVSYKLKLSNYDLFVTVIEKLALNAMDKEFTKVLEEKLSEN